jgi:TolB-like protein/DNA-binding SARP family transcriptional activator
MLKINLLGRFEARLPSGKVFSLPTRKTETLLAYLALVPGPHSRDHLTNLLWSDRGEQQARNSLRQALNALKKLLDGIEPNPLQIEHTNVNLASQSIEIDAVKLEELTRDQTPQAANLAITLYRGEFMEGVVVRDSNGEEWLAFERERYRKHATDALEKVLEFQIETGEQDKAAKSGERLVSLDPLNESGWRRLMGVYATRGDRNYALMAYKRCCEVLNKELGVEPSQETAELETAIRSGNFDATFVEVEPDQMPTNDHYSAVPAEPAMSSLTKKPSIVVLPFDNLSGDPEQDYFSDGITEDIITELTRFHSLFVIARNSSFAFKGQAMDVTEIGKKLGVQFVVAGSVRKSGGRIRIATQLVETSTGNHLWAERYDRNLADIFAVQDEVASQIVTMVPGHVDMANRVRSERKPVQDMSAYDLFLRADHILHWNVGSREAKRLLKQSLEIDPTYARAHARLATVYGFSIFAHGLDVEKALASARIHAETATKLDPSDPVINASLADTYLIAGEHALAGHHIDKAIALNPNDFFVMVIAAEVKDYLGDYEAAIKWTNKAMLSDPYSADSFREIFFEHYYIRGQYEKALEQMIGWRDYSPYVCLEAAAAFAQLDRMSEAREAVQQFENIRPEGWNMGEVIRAHARMYAKPEDAERWMEGFRKAGLDF